MHEGWPVILNLLYMVNYISEESFLEHKAHYKLSRKNLEHFQLIKLNKSNKTTWSKLNNEKKSLDGLSILLIW